jgi:hypothetical protein
MSPADTYDVYIAHAKADGPWQQRLARDLSEFGLSSFSELQPTGPTPSAEALDGLLAPHGAVIVLWTPAARAGGLRRDLGLIEPFTRQRMERLVVPIVLGDRELLGAAPSWLSGRQAAIVGPRTFSAGPQAESEEWTREVSNIARVVLDQRQRTAAETLPSFSTGGRRALTYAARMLGDSEDPGRLRTAALLGALLESARTNMTPTTGDVVRLVLARQSDGRDAERTIVAAAAATGLAPPGRSASQPLGLEELIESSVRELVLDAADMTRRTGADRVRLRHVLATGVHPAVPEEALAELGVTLDEIREEWRASIARTWPDESQEGWDCLV